MIFVSSTDSTWISRGRSGPVTPNIFSFRDAPLRDEEWHFGVNEACMRWRDTIRKYRSLEFSYNPRAAHQPLPMRGDQEVAYTNPFEQV